jgi:hypothetical protein
MMTLKGAWSMVDQTVRRLVEEVVSTPVKLQLLLLFCEHPTVEGTAGQIAQRIYRDIWSTREALHELVEAGVLNLVGAASEPVYRYRPRPEHVEPIKRLCYVYNEPIERDAVQRLVREVASYIPYRRSLQGIGLEYI